MPKKKKDLNDFVGEIDKLYTLVNFYRRKCVRSKKDMSSYRSATLYLDYIDVKISNKESFR